MRLPQTSEIWPNFDQNLGVVNSQNRPNLEICVEFRNKILEMISGGSSIEADKALPHPQSPRSNTLHDIFTFNVQKCGVSSKKIIFLNLKTFFGFEILSFRPLFNPFKNNNLG